jgi:hypothetical protein
MSRSVVGSLYTVGYGSRYQYASTPLGIEVPIELHYSEESVRLRAKIDTGASFCIFQRAYAEILGIEIEEGQPQNFKTANGQFETFGHLLEIVCFDSRVESVVYFAADQGFNRNVLGRAGWIANHRLGIIDHDTTLFMSHYNDPGA